MTPGALPSRRDKIILTEVMPLENALVGVLWVVFVPLFEVVRELASIF